MTAMRVMARARRMERMDFILNEKRMDGVKREKEMEREGKESE